MVKERAEKALRSVTLPSWVDRLEVTQDVDWCNEPALRVSVVLKPGEMAVLEDGDALLGLTRLVHATIDAAGIETFPYLRFVGTDPAKVA